MSDLDIDFVRAQFPAFADPALQNLAFFESAAGSYPCRFVTERLSRFYRERKVQPYEAYDASRLAGDEMDEARSRLAAMMGVDTDEVSFGPSTTQNTYVLAQAFRQWLPEGSAIVVTNQDHEANSGPWRRLEAEGFEIREWKLDPDTGHLGHRRSGSAFGRGGAFVFSPLFECRGRDQRRGRDLRALPVRQAR